MSYVIYIIYHSMSHCISQVALATRPPDMTCKGGSLSGDSRKALRRGNTRHARAKKSSGVASRRKPSGATCHVSLRSI